MTDMSLVVHQERMRRIPFLSSLPTAMVADLWSRLTGV